MKTTKDDYIKLRIHPAKKAALAIIAQKKHLDVSKLLMAEIDKLIEQEELMPIETDTEGKGAGPKQPTKQLYFYPFPGDEQRLNHYSAVRQMKTTNLIRLIVRAWLTRDPLMPKHELAALGVTSNQLGALGRNLNQLVKHAHAGNYPLPGELLALLERALHLSQLARKEVGEIVKANIASWENDYA